MGIKNVPNGMHTVVCVALSLAGCGSEAPARPRSIPDASASDTRVELQMDLRSPTMDMRWEPMVDSAATVEDARATPELPPSTEDAAGQRMDTARSSDGPGTPPDGVMNLYLEIESIDVVSPWMKATTKPGFTGTGYFEWTGGDTRTPNRGVLIYNFDIAKAGRYIIALHGRRDKEGPCASAADDECNDVFSKMNNGEFYKTMVKGAWGQWLWQSRLSEAGPLDGVAVYDLKVGKNTLYLAGRSPGMKLDAIRIYLEGTTPPEAPK